MAKVRNSRLTMAAGSTCSGVFSVVVNFFSGKLKMWLCFLALSPTKCENRLVY